MNESFLIAMKQGNRLKWNCFTGISISKASEKERKKEKKKEKKKGKKKKERKGSEKKNSGLIRDQRTKSWKMVEKENNGFLCDSVWS